MCKTEFVRERDLNTHMMKGDTLRAHKHLKSINTSAELPAAQGKCVIIQSAPFTREQHRNNIDIQEMGITSQNRAPQSNGETTASRKTKSHGGEPILATSVGRTDVSGSDEYISVSELQRVDKQPPSQDLLVSEAVGNLEKQKGEEAVYASLEADIFLVEPGMVPPDSPLKPEVRNLLLNLYPALNDSFIQQQHFVDSQQLVKVSAGGYPPEHSRLCHALTQQSRTAFSYEEFLSNPSGNQDIQALAHGIIQDDISYHETCPYTNQQSFTRQQRYECVDPKQLVKLSEEDNDSIQPHSGSNTLDATPSTQGYHHVSSSWKKILSCPLNEQSRTSLSFKKCLL